MQHTFAPIVRPSRQRRIAVKALHVRFPKERPRSVTAVILIQASRYANIPMGTTTRALRALARGCV